MDVSIVVFVPCDQPNPDIQTAGFSVEVEFCRTACRLCKSAELPHSIQIGHFWKIKEGVTEAIDFLSELPFRFLFLAIKPCCPPSVAIIVGTGIYDLTDRVLCAAQRYWLGLLIDMREGAFCFQRNILCINDDIIQIFLGSVPLRKGKRLGRNTPTSFIIAAGITDMDICIAA